MLLLNGDCIEQMQILKDEGKQIDSVVTDPPYHLTSIVERYGKKGSAPAKYEPGSSGPEDSLMLMHKDGRKWREIS